MKFLMLLVMMSLISCGIPAPIIPPAPPAPIIKTFTVTGKTVTLSGTIKDGNKLKVEDVQMHLNTAIQMLDNK